MQIYNLCMKITKRKLPILLIYVVVFINVLIIVNINFQKSETTQASFSPKKTDIALFSVDSSPLIDGLKRQLEQTANFKDIPDEPEALQDALYFREVTYILRIPSDFTIKMMKGNNVKIEKRTVPGANYQTVIDAQINQYLNTARSYIAENPEITQEELVLSISKDMAIQVEVTMKETATTAAVQSYSAFYFNYLAYVFLSILILAISALMLVFNNPDLQKRSACSPISSNQVNRQFILANFTITFAVWFMMCGLYFLMRPKGSMQISILFHILNAFVFALCCASISYLIGITVKGQSAVSAVSNVVALGSSFLSGVFLPQAFIAAPVLKISSFLPTYWYVKANNQIAEQSSFDIAHAASFLSYILIELGFAVAFLVLALVVGKKKSIRIH